MIGPLPPRPDLPVNITGPPHAWVYEGARYRIGSIDGYWGIWSRSAPAAPPVATFPQTQDGWRAAWTRLRQLDADDHRPFYRRGGGWAVLNVLIGFVFWFGLLFAVGVGLGIAGRDLDHMPDRADAVSGAVSLLLLASAVGGWLYFCYSKRSPKARGFTLGIVYGSSVAVAVAALAPQLQPR